MSEQNTGKDNLPRDSQLVRGEVGTPPPLVFQFSSLSNNPIAQAASHIDTCSALRASILSPPLPRLSRSLSIREFLPCWASPKWCLFMFQVVSVCVHLCVLYVCVYSNQSSQQHYERHTLKDIIYDINTMKDIITHTNVIYRSEKWNSERINDRSAVPAT